MNKIKTFKIFSSILLSSGGVAAAVCSPSITTHFKQKNYFAISEKDNVKETKYLSLEKNVKLTDSSDDSSEDNVVLEQLEEHIQAVEDKAQFQMTAAHLSSNSIKTIIGILKANIDQKKEELLKDYSDSSRSLNQDGLNQMYYYVNEQAKALGVDVVDFYQLANKTIPNTVLAYYNELVESKVSQEDAEQKADEFKEQLVGLLDEAQTQLWDDVHYSLNLSQYQDEMTEAIDNAELSTVLNYACTHFESLLTVNQSYNSISAYADYSSDGNGIKVGDVLTSEQISKIFNFKYCLSVGADFEDYQVENYSATESGEYPQEIINNMFDIAPLSSHSTFAANYDESEILPGYKLNVQVIDMENEINSHKCDVQFKFGICRSTNQEKIIWQTDDELKPNKDGERMNIFSYDVENMNAITNISNNKYYKNLSQVVEIDKKEKKDDDGAYFSDSAKNRTYLDAIMSKYQDTGDYDLQKNPVVLTDPKDYAGIPTIKDYIPEDTYHTNQKIQLVATDIDTNLNILSVSWAYVDTGISPTKENEQISKNNFKVVKLIPWKINKDLYDSIKIKFNIDPNLQKLMDHAKNIYTAASTFNMYFRTLSSDSAEKNLDAINKSIIERGVLLAAIALVEITAIATSSFLAYELAITAGGAVHAAIQLVFISLFIASSISFMVQEGMKLDQDNKAYKISRKIFNLLNESNQNKEYAKEMIDLFSDQETRTNGDLLFDSHAQYSDKKTSSEKIKEIFKIVQADDGHWNFYWNVIQDLNLYSKKDEDKVKKAFVDFNSDDVSPEDDKDHTLLTNATFWKTLAAFSTLHLAQFFAIIGIDVLALEVFAPILKWVDTAINKFVSSAAYDALSLSNQAFWGHYYNETEKWVSNQERLFESLEESSTLCASSGFLYFIGFTVILDAVLQCVYAAIQDTVQSLEF